MADNFLVSYPPSISQHDLDVLKGLAVDWSLAHGLVIRPPPDLGLPNTSVINAPVSLFPSPFPKKCFEKALALQPLFNDLFHKLAEDHEFIMETLGEVAKVDEFIKNLYKIYVKVYTEGAAQPFSLGIHRSDYMLHVSGFSELEILQVEFNTIAASFSSLSALAGEMHRYLLKATNYFDSLSTIKSDSLPQNDACTSVAKAIAKAHELYGSLNSVVLMLVQPRERNAFDQRWIEYDLLQNHNIHLIHKTLSDVYNEGILDPKTKSLYINGKEIAVTYLRAGYGPGDYTTDKGYFFAIKCPSVAYQLVGAKKVQQVLANPGVLERYISNPSDILKIRSCFAGLYPLDNSPKGEAALELALENPDQFVMKPQREGGGSNIYSKDIPSTLSHLSIPERSSYILMDLIKPPPMRNFLLRQGEIYEGEMISELGIYGIFIGSSKKREGNMDLRLLIHPY
ncbi:hypothetical protein G9A89_019412 [Geosiphon pyriformis]|nr:hypothetical protein G9A89_019412 [Geosiphon pyriformis]